MSDDGILNMLNKLHELYDLAYKIHKKSVDYIIKNKVTDINFIEHTLDYILDIYTKKGFYLFLKLCSYYSMVNYENACDYMKILQEIREDEYNEYIKIKK